MTERLDPKDGTLKSNYKSGSVMLEAQFSEGEKHGPFVLRYESGQKMLEGNWERGLPDGMTTTWFANGKTRQQVEFLQGLPHGTWKTWDESGRLREEKEYLLGNAVGKWREWNENGDLVRDEFNGTTTTNIFPNQNFIRRIFKHPYFLRIAVITLIHFSLSVSLFYLVEGGKNSQVTTFSDAIFWFFSTIPFLGRVHIQPVTGLGYGVVIISHFASFFLFCVWTALIGWSIFAQGAYRAALAEIKGQKKSFKE